MMFAVSVNRTTASSSRCEPMRIWWDQSNESSFRLAVLFLSQPLIAPSLTSHCSDIPTCADQRRWLCATR